MSPLVRRGYLLADRYPVDVAEVIRAATYAYATLSGPHAAAVQIRQVRMVLAEALSQVQP